MLDRRLCGERRAQFLQARECIPRSCFVRRLREEHEAVSGAGKVLYEMPARTIQQCQRGSRVQIYRPRAHAWQLAYVRHNAVVIGEMHQPPAAEGSKAFRHRHGRLLKVPVQRCRVPQAIAQSNIHICQFKLSSLQCGARN